MDTVPPNSFLIFIIFCELLLIFFITHYNTGGCTKVRTLLEGYESYNAYKVTKQVRGVRTPAKVTKGVYCIHLLQTATI